MSKPILVSQSRKKCRRMSHAISEMSENTAREKRSYQSMKPEEKKACGENEETKAARRNLWRNEMACRKLSKKGESEGRRRKARKYEHSCICEAENNKAWRRRRRRSAGTKITRRGENRNSLVSAASLSQRQKACSWLKTEAYEEYEERQKKERERKQKRRENILNTANMYPLNRGENTMKKIRRMKKIYLQILAKA